MIIAAAKESRDAERVRMFIIGLDPDDVRRLAKLGCLEQKFAEIDPALGDGAFVVTGIRSERTFVETLTGRVADVQLRKGGKVVSIESVTLNEPEAGPTVLGDDPEFVITHTDQAGRVYGWHPDHGMGALDDAAVFRLSELDGLATPGGGVIRLLKSPVAPVVVEADE